MCESSQRLLGMGIFKRVKVLPTFARHGHILTGESFQRSLGMDIFKRVKVPNAAFSGGPVAKDKSVHCEMESE